MTRREEEEDSATLQKESFALEISRPWPPYEYDTRPRRDKWAAVLYVLLVSVAAIGSIVAMALTDRNAMQYGHHFYQNSTSCILANYSASAPPQDQLRKTFGIVVVISMVFWVPISVGVGIAMSLLYLWLFRQHTFKMVVASAVIAVLALMGVGIYILVQGINIALGIVVLVVAVVAAGLFWWMRSDLVLCAELLAITCKGLYQCPGIIKYTALLLCVGLAILAFLFCGMTFGIFIGEIARNPARASESAAEGDVTTCFDAHGRTTTCCIFKTAGWARAHVVITTLALLWTYPTLLQLQLYIVSDAMAQWYYEPKDCSDARLRVSLQRALRHGLTSSFGSVCIAGAILMAVQCINNLCNWMQQSTQGCLSYVATFFSCIIQLITSVIDQFTIFSVVSTAVFGLSFCGSSRKVAKTLKRNLLTVFNFWGMPSLVLLIIICLATLAWAGAVLAVVYIRWTLMEEEYSNSELLKVAAVVCFASAAAVGIILYFVTSIMVNAVNAVFVFYLLDLDHKSETRPEIHEICERTPLLAAAAAKRSEHSGLLDAAPATQSDGAPLLSGPGERSDGAAGTRMVQGAKAHHSVLVN